MLLCHSHRFLFIHVPKAGGTTVKVALGRALLQWWRGAAPEQRQDLLYAPDPKLGSFAFAEHVTAAELKQRLPAGIFEGYFKFAVARHPLDWLVSNYFYFLESRPAEPLLAELGFQGTLRLFLDRAGGTLPIPGVRLTQKAFIADERGRLLVDRVLRFENLAGELDATGRALGLGPVVAGHFNGSTHDPYLSYYTPELIEQVARALPDDFDTFGYAVPTLPESPRP